MTDFVVLDYVNSRLENLILDKSREVKLCVGGVLEGSRRRKEVMGLFDGGVERVGQLGRI